MLHRLPYCLFGPWDKAVPRAAEWVQTNPIGWHYRRLIVPELVAKRDRSIVFPGHIHSAFTPLAAELHALWGFAFLNDWMNLPGKEEMELEAATLNTWTRKRYIEQGKKHSYFIYDYISYLDILMRDLGLNPRRKKTVFEEWFVPYWPQDYRGLLQESQQGMTREGELIRTWGGR